MRELLRTKWAAVGAAVAVTLGAGGVSLTQAAISTGEKPVYISLDAPCRVIDTRSGSPIGAGDANALTVQITGTNGECKDTLAIPADAVGVATNVTAIAPNGAASGRSYFTVYPADATRPVTSNLNFVNGQPPVPNKVDVGLSADGKIKIYNNEGTAHAAVDIFGYYVDHNHDDRYYQKSETYTKGEVDSAVASATGALPETMYVMTNANNAGAITRQSGGISLAHSGPGSAYFYTFPRDVTSCVWTASLGGAGTLDNLLAVTGHLGISASQGNQGLFAVDPDEVAVSVYDQDDGAVVVSAHTLVVTCP